MSAVEALAAAREAGVRLKVQGTHLLLEAESEPPSFVVSLLGREKASIMALLQSTAHGWNPQDWRVYFEERAGIAEYDWGRSRSEAESIAFDCCVAEWMNCNAAKSGPSVCPQCRRGSEEHDPLLPFGSLESGHSWLHLCCWPVWYAQRREEAVLVMLAMGIGPYTKSVEDRHETNR